ncbi:MAG: AtpZ/AtpI family protein [Pseudomonadota bacterium]
MVDDGNERVTKLPEDRRLDSLEERVRSARQAEDQRVGKVTKQDDSERQGTRVMSLLLGGIFGGSLLGWLMDGWFGTGHILLLVGLVLGVTGAFWSILKMAAPRA